MKQSKRNRRRLRLSSMRRAEFAVRLAKYSFATSSVLGSQGIVDVQNAFAQNPIVDRTRHVVPFGNDLLLDIDSDGQNDFLVSNRISANIGYTLPTITVTPNIGNIYNSAAAAYVPITLPTITITPNLNTNTSALRGLRPEVGTVVSGTSEAGTAGLSNPTDLIDDADLFGTISLASFQLQDGTVGGPLVPTVGSQFVGIRFPGAGGIHYGSMHMSVDQNLSLVIDGIAYEPTPGVSILAGAAVPEPASLALLAMGAGGLLACRRRRRDRT